MVNAEFVVKMVAKAVVSCLEQANWVNFDVAWVLLLAPTVLLGFGEGVCVRVPSKSIHLFMCTSPPPPPPLLRSPPLARVRSVIESKVRS